MSVRRHFLVPRFTSARLTRAYQFLPATRIGQQWISQVTGSTYFSDQLENFLKKFAPSDLENIAPEEQAYNSKYIPQQNVAVSYVNSESNGFHDSISTS